MADFTKQLHDLGACSEAIEWVNGRSLRKCWQVADRPDWMLWLVNKLNICEREQHELSCDFAERVLKYVPDGEDRPRIAIETKRNWLNGEIDDARADADDARAVRAAEEKYQCKLIRKRIPVERIEEALK